MTTDRVHDDDDLLACWRAEEQPQPSGWSFADLEGRMTTDPTPWAFDDLCVAALGRARHALDLGTGGGEQLLALRARLLAAGGTFPTTTATEGWPPNVEVARAALAPAGIDLVAFGQPDGRPDAEPMPFDDGAFDLVLDRHEAYHPEEVARVLAPGGVFLTQQVGGDELGELRALLGTTEHAPHVRFARFRDALASAGLEVLDGAEHVGCYRFADVAAVVAYLQRVPWEQPADFSVDRYAAPLLALHRQSAGGEVALTRTRFWLHARRPV
jgi:SAM-dependent methyltransferase